MKSIDDAVIELNGVLDDNNERMWRDMSGNRIFELKNGEIAKFTGVIFEKRAKELGFVGGYRFMKENKPEGKPNLHDDVMVSILTFCRGRLTGGTVGFFNWDSKEIKSWRIVDDRYKPTDTSYLDKPDSSTHSAESSTDNGADWYDYDNHKALRLPPVGVECLLGEKKVHVVAAHHYDSCVICSVGQFRGELLYGHIDNLRPLDYDRKAEAEKKKLIDQAKAACFAPNSQPTLTTIDCLIAAGWRPTK